MAPSIAPPEAFTRAVAQLRSVTPRPEIVVETPPAPQRLAPCAYALAGTVSRPGDQQAASGRLILLYDPAVPDPWGGPLRLVTYLTAELEIELATDPLLPAVGWSWLTEALADHGAHYIAIAGTVTQTASTSFGDLAGPPSIADLEIRASWTPVDSDLSAHMNAWFAVLASTAGLPPPGVRALTWPAASKA
jgi:hypothetical protein